MTHTNAAHPVMKSISFIKLTKCAGCKRHVILLYWLMIMQHVYIMYNYCGETYNNKHNQVLPVGAALLSRIASNSAPSVCEHIILYYDLNMGQFLE